MRAYSNAKHDDDLRKAAIELFEQGCGYYSTATALSLPRNTVRRWLLTYRAFGSEELLFMSEKRTKYTYEQKVAAASAVVDDGMAKSEAMGKFGVVSLTTLERWCRSYREGGADALKFKPKGRPKGSVSKPRELTREEELEERVRMLETENAYLKKLRALVEGEVL